MKFYLAPMEGITGYVYRNACQEFFPGVDKYVTPFITPKQKKGFTSKELNDILPEHNQGMEVVPQILTNQAEDFLRTAKELNEYGYREINLNLGCPSGTVVSKGKGAGFLAHTKGLEEFFDEIFASEAIAATGIEISVKTRLGMSEPEEFYELLEIYNKYPIKELTIHPRVRMDYYKNTPNRMIYKESLQKSKNPVCYNGDIFTVGDYEELLKDCPETQAVMIGRGMIANPGLIRQLKGGNPVTKEELRAFHDRLWQTYRSIMSGDLNALYKMKEVWLYMQEIFTSSESYMKKIKKAENAQAFEIAVNSLFREQEIVEM